MDLGKAFSFPFQTTQWVEKLLLPALITLIPIFGQIFLLGWYLDITRRVIHRDPDPLPTVDLVRSLTDGLKALVIDLVYLIPLIVLGVLVVVAARANGAAQTNAGSLGFALLLAFLLILIVLYIIALTVLLPAAWSNFIAKEDISAAFRFNEVFGLLRKAPSAYLMVFLVAILTSIIAPLGWVAFAVGAAATTLYAMAINGYVYGMAYNQATAQMAQ